MPSLLYADAFLSYAFIIIIITFMINFFVSDQPLCVSNGLTTESLNRYDRLLECKMRMNQGRFFGIRVLVHTENKASAINHHSGARRYLSQLLKRVSIRSKSESFEVILMTLVEHHKQFFVVCILKPKTLTGALCYSCGTSNNNQLRRICYCK